MISEQEMRKRVLVNRIKVHNKNRYFVIVDSKVVYETPWKQSAYRRAQKERDRLSVKELYYDVGLDIRPDKMFKMKEDMRNNVKIRYPKIGDFPYCWRVYYGSVLIGSYRSAWEAEQYKKKVILEGGY